MKNAKRQDTTPPHRMPREGGERKEETAKQAIKGEVEREKAGARKDKKTEEKNWNERARRKKVRKSDGMEKKRVHRSETNKRTGAW